MCKTFAQVENRKRVVETYKQNLLVDSKNSFTLENEDENECDINGSQEHSIRKSNLRTEVCINVVYCLQERTNIERGW